MRRSGAERRSEAPAGPDGAPWAGPVRWGRRSAKTPSLRLSLNASRAAPRRSRSGSVTYAETEPLAGLNGVRLTHTFFTTTSEQTPIPDPGTRVVPRSQSEVLKRLRNGGW